ncbi:MAG TPA: ABC transporter ATP-binding protein [Rhizomicrobium sp.]|jgi:iron complex transport system ATP-binding protein|nr:ABC transporter ATP-binding protein [Rhizomicrobium sp.]
MTLLAAEHISVSRPTKGKDRRAILRDVSLQAHAGEFIALLGPNGAGKSTLLSVLAGLLKPDTGEVMLDAYRLSRLTALELARRRAYLPQNPKLEWPLSVERLVALGLTPRLPATGGLPESYAPAITRALELCDLTSRRDQVATTLSGGEFARAMLARAIVNNPQVLIVDEPITGLDPKHAMQCMSLLRDFAKTGTLVIAALHELTLSSRYASRAIVVVDGAMVFDADSLTEEVIHSAFGVRAMAVGMGDSRGFTLLSPSEK